MKFETGQIDGFLTQDDCSLYGNGHGPKEGCASSLLSCEVSVVRSKCAQCGRDHGSLEICPTIFQTNNPALGIFSGLSYISLSGREAVGYQGSIGIAELERNAVSDVLSSVVAAQIGAFSHLCTVCGQVHRQGDRCPTFGTAVSGGIGMLRGKYEPWHLDAEKCNFNLERFTSVDLSPRYGLGIMKYALGEACVSVEAREGILNAPGSVVFGKQAGDFSLLSHQAVSGPNVTIGCIHCGRYHGPGEICFTATQSVDTLLGRDSTITIKPYPAWGLGMACGGTPPECVSSIHGAGAAGSIWGEQNSLEPRVAALENRIDELEALLEACGLTARGNTPGISREVRSVLGMLKDKGYDIACAELTEAMQDLVRSPQPDLSGVVQHAVAGLECAARAVTGKGNDLGKLLREFSGELGFDPTYASKLEKNVWSQGSQKGRHLSEVNAPTEREARQLFWQVVEALRQMLR